MGMMLATIKGALPEYESQSTVISITTLECLMQSVPEREGRGLFLFIVRSACGTG
jgi:hypothetical protein